MRKFSFDRQETTELVAHGAFRLMDAFTLQRPIGRVRTYLDRQAPGDTWELTGVEPIATASGILIYAGLEKRHQVIGEPPRRYRFRVEADRYVPDYAGTRDGLEFDAYPYNDDVVVNPFAATVDVVLLHPGPTYQFAPEIPVLRGNVVRASNGKAVAYASVAKADVERTRTDDRGEFALPLRRIEDPQFDIDVVDERMNESRTKTILIPEMLGINVVIDIM